mmetsp:Transcript_10114/g.20452  ORF Transcript_10114/g.20452 Transcript_10114/m.20452 type:complete len:110 (+) Transcript_10114:398-727(+)
MPKFLGITFCATARESDNEPVPKHTDQGDEDACEQVDQDEESNRLRLRKYKCAHLKESGTTIQGTKREIRTATPFSNRNRNNVESSNPTIVHTKPSSSPQRKSFSTCHE